MKRNDQAGLRREIVNLRLIPTSLVAAAVGLILLFLAGLARNVLGTVLTGIGVAALTAAFVGLLSDVFLRRQVLDEVLAMVRLQDDVVNEGILGITRWEGVVLSQFFEDNPGDVDVGLVLGRSFASNHARAIIERAATLSATVRVSILDPDGDPALLAEYGKLFGNRGAAAVQTDIRSAITIWEDAKEQQEKEGKNVNLILQRLSTTLPFTFYRSGKQMWVILNSGRRTRSNPPAIRCEKTPGDGGLFKLVLNEIEAYGREGLVK
ncbi:MAG: hypothetical protein ABI401_13375 [Candidatus Dormibacter sp.]